MPAYSNQQSPPAHSPANNSPYAGGPSLSSSSPAFQNPFDDVPQPQPQLQQQQRPAASANYADALKQLENMGFQDRQRNIIALAATRGNVAQAVDRLCS
jgi:hypothetical protein